MYTRVPWVQKQNVVQMAPSPGFEKVPQCDLQDLSLCSLHSEAEQNNSCDAFCFQGVNQTWEHYEGF